MRIVVALGGNALLRRGEPMTLETQQRNARTAAKAIASIQPNHTLVVTHGNGPQIGLLALQAAAHDTTDPTPLDVLGAETEGQIGYTIEQELRNALPRDIEIVTVLTMVEVDPTSPAFASPTKFIGPGYDQAQAARLATEHGWAVRQDGTRWRRVVPSPLPQRILQMTPIRTLVEQGTIVIAAGGGGIPMARQPDGTLRGVEAVIDKDHCSALLAQGLQADLLLLATDVPAVFLDWGTPAARPIRTTTPDALSRHDFPPGSMGPKVDSACDFVRRTGNIAAIGALSDLPALVRGDAGTIIRPGENRVP